MFCRGPSDPEGATFDRDQAPAMLAAVRKAIRTAAVHAAHSCVPDALTNARRFSPCMRWWLYRHLVMDHEGRLAQAARIAPGVAIFAFALDEAMPFRPLAGQLLEGIRTGTPLNRLLDAVLEQWVQSAPEFAARRGPRAGGVWANLLDATGPSRARLLRQQRLLIRRALPRVPPTLLLLPPPLAFAPEDIPSTVRANAHWYRVMKGAGVTLVKHPSAPAEIDLALSSFASRQATKIEVTHRREVPETMRMLALFCHATRRRPSRNTEPGRLIEQAKIWTAKLTRIARQRAGTRTPPHEIVSVGLPVDDALAWDSTPLSVTPLRTVGELLEEGEKMANCVANRAGAALGRACVLCHATIHGRPHTLELRRARSGWSLTDLRGFANELPTREAVQALHPWLTARNVALDDSILLQENDEAPPDDPFATLLHEVAP
jgi:hypothetical protein